MYFTCKVNCSAVEGRKPHYKYNQAHVLALPEFAVARVWAPAISRHDFIEGGNASFCMRTTR